MQEKYIGTEYIKQDEHPDLISKHKTEQNNIGCIEGYLWTRDFNFKSVCH